MYRELLYWILAKTRFIVRAFRDVAIGGLLLMILLFICLFLGVSFMAFDAILAHLWLERMLIFVSEVLVATESEMQ